ncbi:hypothetical protein ABG067_006449 [Albugo candida]
MWQGNWSTIKVSNPKACALYHEIANVGKLIESSKKRVIWRIKVLEGRDYEISLTHSLASGKKVIRIDGIVKHVSSALSFTDWEHVLSLPGAHVIHVLIKPSVDLNDMYDLIIDGISFRRLPDRFDEKKIGTNTSERLGEQENNRTYNYSSGNYGNAATNTRASSFGSWECPRCTLVNTKPLAPVCEVCGCAKPANIQTQNRVRNVSAGNPPTSALPASNLTNFRPKSEPVLLIQPSAPPSDPFLDPFNGGKDPFARNVAPSEVQPHGIEPGTSRDQIASMLSGLDFSAVPAVDIRPVEVAVEEPQSAPNEAAQAHDGDLWKSNMVDLNLNAKPAGRMLPAKQFQTLEQARRSAPIKEKTPVLPPPQPTLYPTSSMPQYVGPVHAIPGQTGYTTNFSGPVPATYNSAYGDAGMPFLPNASASYTPNNPLNMLNKNIRSSNDPFATLS